MAPLEGQATPRPGAAMRWRAKLPDGLLWLLGGAMPLIYGLGMALPFPLSFGLAYPRGTWVAPGQGSLLVMGLQIGLYLLLTLLYVAALHLLALAATGHPRRTPLGLIWLVWALASLALLFVAPNGESHDIYDYVFRGRMLDRYGASPLEVTPDQFPKAPFYRYVAWKRHVDTYGPLWEYGSLAVSKTVRIALERLGALHEQLPTCPQSPPACRTLAAYVTGYRLLALLLTGLSARLLYAMIQHSHPALAPLALATWLWNPLLLISTALGAHNDALMLLLVFLCYWLWQRGRWVAGWLAIGLAVQVKLTVLLLVPVLGLWLARKVSWRRALGISLLAAVLTVGLSWLLYAPLGGWATLPRMLYERQLFVSHSLAQILYFWLYKWSNWPYALVWLMMVPWGAWLFLATAPPLLLRAYSRFAESTGPSAHPFSLSNLPFREGLDLSRNLISNPSPEGGSLHGYLNSTELYRSCTLFTLLYLLVGSFWFQPWYLLWVLAPAALWVDGRFPRLSLPWFCFGALCSNVVYDHLTQLRIAAQPEADLFRLGVTLLVVATIWLPLFVAQWLVARHQ
jgi:hypothetical protein